MRVYASWKLEPLVTKICVYVPRGIFGTEIGTLNAGSRFKVTIEGDHAIVAFAVDGDHQVIDGPGVIGPTGSTGKSLPNRMKTPQSSKPLASGQPAVGLPLQVIKAGDDKKKSVPFLNDGDSAEVEVVADAKEPRLRVTRGR